jgi:hypothetical protein
MHYIHTTGEQNRLDRGDRVDSTTRSALRCWALPSLLLSQSTSYSESPTMIASANTRWFEGGGCAWRDRESCICTYDYTVHGDGRGGTGYRTMHYVMEREYWCRLRSNHTALLSMGLCKQWYWYCISAAQVWSILSDRNSEACNYSFRGNSIEIL